MDARRLAAVLSVLALTALTGCRSPRIQVFNDPLSPQEHITLGVSYEATEE